MVPFTSPRLVTVSSEAWLSTSTSALPMPSTSSSADSATRARSRLCREMPVEEQGELLARAGREGTRIGDDRAAEGLGASVPARLRDERDDATEHFLGRGHVLHEIGHHRLNGDRVVLLVPHVVVGE